MTEGWGWGGPLGWTRRSSLDLRVCVMGREATCAHRHACARPTKERRARLTSRSIIGGCGANGCARGARTCCVCVPVLCERAREMPIRIAAHFSAFGRQCACESGCGVPDSVWHVLHGCGCGEEGEENETTSCYGRKVAAGVVMLGRDAERERARMAFESASCDERHDRRLWRHVSCARVVGCDPTAPNHDARTVRGRFRAARCAESFANAVRKK